MAFNLQDYEMVEERLKRWWEHNPDGIIETELVSNTDYACVFVARIFRTIADQKPTATGWARTVFGANKQTAEFGLELAETSAIGRALSNYIYSGKKRPSREEMSKIGNFERVKPQGGKIQVENPEDAWTVKTVEAPKPLDIAEAFGSSEEIPHCKHGAMNRKEGTSKTGKAYMGYVCPQGVGVPNSEACLAIWYELTPSGKWRPQEKK